MYGFSSRFRGKLIADVTDNERHQQANPPLQTKQGHAVEGKLNYYQICV